MKTFKEYKVGEQFWDMLTSDMYTKLDEEGAQKSDGPTGKTYFNPGDELEDY